jgi:2,3-bisphosphoglycerate-dependent phosphoglycerate mutase
VTRIYFVRHAKPDFSVHDDLTRPLTEEGLKDSLKVTEFLGGKDIHKIFSSPYKRTFDTVRHLAESLNLNIEIVEDLRERKVDDVWIEDFNAFAKAQWSDFQYKLANGENLNEVQKRNIDTLQQILKENMDKNIVIGTHGTAMSTIINYYDDKFDYSQFERIKNLMPFVVCMDFNGTEVVEIKEFAIT